MSMMEFYEVPAHRTVEAKKLTISFPADEKFVEKKIEGLGGMFLSRVENRGEILIPEVRIPVMQRAFPHYEIL